MGINSGLAELAVTTSVAGTASQMAGNVMETKVQKKMPRTVYLGLVVVFAALILWAFLKIAGRM